MVVVVVDVDVEVVVVVELYDKKSNFLNFLPNEKGYTFWKAIFFAFWKRIPIEK